MKNPDINLPKIHTISVKSILTIEYTRLDMSFMNHQSSLLVPMFSVTSTYIVIETSTIRNQQFLDSYFVKTQNKKISSDLHT